MLAYRVKRPEDWNERQHEDAENQWQRQGQAVGNAEGFVKLIFCEPYGELLGAHIIGPEATEMIDELGLALTLEAIYRPGRSKKRSHLKVRRAIGNALASSAAMESGVNRVGRLGLA